MNSKIESVEEKRLKADYSTRMSDVFALNEWASLVLMSVCLTIMEDIHGLQMLHGPRLWGYWAALFGALLFSSAGSKHAGRLAGYVDGYADGRKSAGL